MSASYPDHIYEPREVENLAGIEFDSANKKTFYAEDFSMPAGEIVAIETELGGSVKGTFTDLRTRLSAYSSNLLGSNSGDDVSSINVENFFDNTLVENVVQVSVLYKTAQPLKFYFNTISENDNFVSVGSALIYGSDPFEPHIFQLKSLFAQICTDNFNVYDITFRIKKIALHDFNNKLMIYWSGCAKNSGTESEIAMINGSAFCFADELIETMTIFADSDTLFATVASFSQTE